MEGRGLAAGAAFRELLHDADEGLLGFDCSTPLKPYLGEGYARLTRNLQAAIAERYRLEPWSSEEYLLHKRADRLAAISEARHVAGWSLDEIREEFGTAEVLEDDPLHQGGLALPSGLEPWEPWPPKLAVQLFLTRLQQLSDHSWRDRTLARLAAAFSRAPDRLRHRCADQVRGDARHDTLVRAEAPTGETWDAVASAGLQLTAEERETVRAVLNDEIMATGNNTKAELLASVLRKLPRS